MEKKRRKKPNLYQYAISPHTPALNIVIYFNKQQYFGKWKFSKSSITPLSQSLDLVRKLYGSDSVELVILFNWIDGDNCNYLRWDCL